MSVLSADERPEGEYDICVVGAGPVGLALAMEAAEAGARVLLVDAGDDRSGRRESVPVPGESTEIVDLARHAPLELTTRQGVGGTSWLWGGRCVAFEPIDLEPRDYVPGSGDWPIRLGDVEPFFAAAARHLDCGAPVFRSDAPEWAGLDEFRMSNLERWARRPKLGPRLGARVLAHPRVTALLGARLAGVEFPGDNGVVAELAVIRGGERMPIRAASSVLAMGGLEVTRLLLRAQRDHASAFGGQDGPLGRYYMGHATGSIADIVLTDPASAADLDFVRDAVDTYVRRRFTLDEAAQRRHRLLNTSFYLDNPAFYEAEHRNATLSAVFLGIAIPPIGRAILAEGIRLRHVGPRPYRLRAHIGNIVRAPWRAAADVVDIIGRRYLSRVRKPGFLLRNAGGRYALHYHGEQLPNPDSRVTLVRDAAGGDVLRVDYRYLEADVDSLLRCHELLDAELRRAGLGRLEYAAPDAAGIRALAWEQTTDGFHSIGTTRMSDDPAQGVVDAECRVHGTENLFIASSSVLTTSAEANPTFFAAALAVRLAHHLTTRPKATVARHAGSTRA
ncbi:MULTISPECIES: GMC family oxidoreductase [unclassified Microbacterium]|uniref:GMC family oxidoreductase n=1 Tax=unclassified Microbacterium TaxID=2609290 RepID=UPI0038675E78